MYTDKKLIILAQAFISCFMAFLMTGIMGFVHGGFAEGWHMQWMTGFVLAWPIAFLLSMVVGPLGFRLAMFTLDRFQRS